MKIVTVVHVTHTHTHCQSSPPAHAYLACLLITIIIVINIIVTLTSGDSVTDRQTDRPPDVLATVLPQAELCDLC